ncbi:hypothetical protein CG419_09505 [Latilactobacillus curvatus]|uniref:DUF1648 domain-containing protein n=1 Tax=Latilactobacillus curvatus TaxID=28038 RepID=A0AAC9UT61_LATCU|nr:hypothetical protein CG419_09505 [Latilactobacillus curvatus]
MMNSKVFKFNAAHVTIQFLIVLVLRNSLKSTIPNHFSFNGIPDSYLHGANLPLILGTIVLINLFGYFIYLLPLRTILSPRLNRLLYQTKSALSIWLYAFSWSIIPFFFMDSNRLLEHFIFSINILLVTSCLVIIVKNLVVGQ